MPYNKNLNLSLPCVPATGSDFLKGTFVFLGPRGLQADFGTKLTHGTEDRFYLENNAWPLFHVRRGFSAMRDENSGLGQVRERDSDPAR